jgi:hypothetical protein
MKKDKTLNTEQADFLKRLKDLFIFYNNLDMSQNDDYYNEKESLINELMENDF